MRNCGQLFFELYFKTIHLLMNLLFAYKMQQLKFIQANCQDNIQSGFSRGCIVNSK